MSVKERFMPWLVENLAWEVCRYVVVAIGGALVASFGWAHFRHTDNYETVYLFLTIIGVLAILWGIGLLPRSRKKTIDFREPLRNKCDRLIVAWGELADLWVNAQKEPNDPKTLPDPMAGWWVSSQRTTFPYKVGVLQGQTWALLENLSIAGVPTEHWDDRVSMTNLIESLRRYKDQLR